MHLETLKTLMELSKRENFFKNILEELESFGEFDNVFYKLYEIHEGFIPCITIAKSLDVKKTKHVKIFVAGQHNEYNGLFAILEFFKLLQKRNINFNEILIQDQVLIFLPLMNPHGFLNPTVKNKSGYYLKNGSNLNRFWRRTFVPEFKNGKDDLNEYPVPEHAEIVRKLLEKYWEQEDITLYVLDFHETSLLKRFPKELSLNLNKESTTYKFDHWLKELIILNILKLYKIPYYRKPLFRKCSTDANHTHIQLSMKQLDFVYEKLLDYISKNYGKLPFYFCYSDKSKEYCQKLANTVYNKLKDKNMLWETNFPSIDHNLHDHGCFVKMSDATPRPKVFSMELENQKQFFNIFNEIENSKIEPNYFEEKLRLINLSIKLALESIKEMIKLF